LDAPPPLPPYFDSTRSILPTQNLIPCLYCTPVTSPYQMNRAPDVTSPKPMVDGFIEIFLRNFRNGCDEKSATITRHSPHRNPSENSTICFCYLSINQKKTFKNSCSGKMEKSLKLPTLDFQNFKSANAEYFSAHSKFAARPIDQF